jgi:FkbM family methyltransferase
MYRIKLFLLTVITFLPIVFICSLNLTSEYAFAGSILEHGEKLYSPGDEELIIRDFFNDRRGGIFVDVGCYDYMSESTTYYLEKHLGWSGIGVDALAEFAIGYIENRPNTRFFNFIVTDHSWSIEPFYRLTNLIDGSSATKKCAEDAANYWKVSKKYQIIYVPTITLTDLLKLNGISKIDFLNIDIQGGEPAALAGFDIERFKPELVCIEAEWNRAKILDYFSRHNYERIYKYLNYDKHNWYFRPKQ